MEALAGNQTYQVGHQPMLRVQFVCFLLMMCGSAFAPYPKEQLPEYEVKAVFLLNFTRFTEWSESAFPDPQAPFIIGVVGESKILPHLERTVLNEKYLGHPILIQHFKEVQDITKCHMLFVAGKSKSKAQQILSTLPFKKHMLTVGEARGFGEIGGIIEFEEKQSKLKLKINKESAEEAQLQISVKLLRLAKIVSTENSTAP